MVSFTWIDWVIAAIVAISALLSLKRGVFKEVLSLLTWLAALFVAWTFGGALAARLKDYIETPSVQVMAACAMLFVATLLVGALVNRIVSELVQATGLSGTDRLLGMVFGGLRGCLVVVVLVGIMTFAPLEQDSAWKNSVLLPHFLMLADWSKETAMHFVGPLLEEVHFSGSV
ncbi:CvpA family protein [Endozoicomonas sp. Mp262]|uniref:CvpA family protein n=1 Tax=Endozoicomonas sp. Mp262 TaxID=2919499 RepID=UPI0021D8CC05